MRSVSVSGLVGTRGQDFIPYFSYLQADLDKGEDADSYRTMGIQGTDDGRDDWYNQLFLVE